MCVALIMADPVLVRAFINVRLYIYFHVFNMSIQANTPSYILKTPYV